MQQLKPEQLNDSDDSILDFMADKGGRVSPSWIADNTRVSSSYVSMRLKRLKEHGHVEQPHRGLWVLVDDPREKNDE